MFNSKAFAVTIPLSIALNYGDKMADITASHFDSRFIQFYVIHVEMW